MYDFILIIALIVLGNFLPADKPYPPVRLTRRTTNQRDEQHISTFNYDEANENHEWQVDSFIVDISSLDTRQDHTFRVVNGPSDAYVVHGCSFVRPGQSIQPEVLADGTVAFKFMSNVARFISKAQRVCRMAIYTLDGQINL